MKLQTLKSIYIILLIIVLIAIPTRSHALGDIFTSAKDFLKAGQGSKEIINNEELNNVSDTIYSILLAVAIIVAIVVGAFLGIQLMMQGAEGKAQIKEALLPYAIGCIIVFGAFGIWKVVVTVVQTIETV